MSYKNPDFREGAKEYLDERRELDEQGDRQTGFRLASYLDDWTRQVETLVLEKQGPAFFFFVKEVQNPRGEVVRRYFYQLGCLPPQLNSMPGVPYWSATGRDNRPNQMANRVAREFGTQTLPVTKNRYEIIEWLVSLGVGYTSAIFQLNLSGVAVPTIGPVPVLIESATEPATEPVIEPPTEA